MSYYKFYPLTAVGLTVSITPAQISVIDIPPSNTFNLTCTATSASTSAATKVFTWSKQALGSGSSTELIHNGGSVIIATSGDTSTLTASETQSGGYVYNCSARIGDAEPSSDTATVNVRGITCIYLRSCSTIPYFLRHNVGIGL